MFVFPHCPDRQSAGRVLVRMPGVSRYEREQIESFLKRSVPPPSIEPGTGLAIFDAGDLTGRFIYDAAIAPALRAAGLNQSRIELAFSDESSLGAVAGSILSAEAIVVDVSRQNAAIFYCLGLCHALGRCPLLLSRESDELLPFDLRLLRCIQYNDSQTRLHQLRDDLARALRNFLAAASH